MNRNLFLAAAAASLCFSLVACGGGGGSTETASAAPVSAPPASAPGSTDSSDSGSTGGKVSTGPGAPSTPPAWVNPNPIPNCTPKMVVVALQGDLISRTEFQTGELQALMDTQFGPGSTTVLNYALGGQTSDTYLYIVGDVVVSSFGVWDMLSGVDPQHYADNLKAMRTTLVVTQTPVITEADNNPTPYLDAAKGTGLPVADAFAYVTSLVSNDNPLSSMIPDGLYPNHDLSVKLVDNVIAPAVAKQVAPMRCVQL